MKKNKIDIQLLIKRYNDLHSLRKTGNEFELSYNTVRRILNAKKIDTSANKKIRIYIQKKYILLTEKDIDKDIKTKIY